MFPSFFDFYGFPLSSILFYLFLFVFEYSGDLFPIFLCIPINIFCFLNLRSRSRPMLWKLSFPFQVNPISVHFLSRCHGTTSLGRNRHDTVCDLSVCRALGTVSSRPIDCVLSEGHSFSFTYIINFLNIFCNSNMF